jgi:hypothetical protein
MNDAFKIWLSIVFVEIQVSLAICGGFVSEKFGIREYKNYQYYA